VDASPNFGCLLHVQHKDEAAGDGQQRQKTPMRYIHGKTLFAVFVLTKLLLVT